MTTEEQMPDEIWAVLSPHNLILANVEKDDWNSFVKNEPVKYIRADLANKPALDAEVRVFRHAECKGIYEAANAYKKLSAQIEHQKSMENTYMDCVEIEVLETIIRAASAVQECGHCGENTASQRICQRCIEHINESVRKKPSAEVVDMQEIYDWLYPQVSMGRMDMCRIFSLLRDRGLKLVKEKA